MRFSWMMRIFPTRQYALVFMMSKDPAEFAWGA
jgi:hypothetical protein